MGLVPYSLDERLREEEGKWEKLAQKQFNNLTDAQIKWQGVAMGISIARELLLGRLDFHGIDREKF